MIASVFGVMIGGLNQDKDYFEYEDILFKIERNGLYSFSVNGGDYLIFNEPSVVEGFIGEVPFDFLLALNSRTYEKIYLDSSDKKAQQIINLFYINFNKKLNIGFSCTPEMQNEEHCLEWPIKSCDNKGEGAILLNFLSVNENDTQNSVSYEDGCFNAVGELDYLEGISDSIVMNYAGVFDDR